MAGTCHPSAGLDGKWRFCAVAEWSEWTVSDVDTVSIDRPLCTWPGILQIVASVMLDHCRPFIGAWFFSVIVRAAALPSVNTLVMFDQSDGLSLGTEVFLRVQFDSLYRLDLGTAPVKINSAILIREQVGVHDCLVRIVNVGMERIRDQLP